MIQERQDLGKLTPKSLGDMMSVKPAMVSAPGEAEEEGIACRGF